MPKKSWSGLYAGVIFAFFWVAKTTVATGIVPTNLGELGLVSSHPARVFNQGSKVLYKRAHVQVPNEGLTRNFAYLSANQFQWQDILFGVKHEPGASRIAFALQGYGRASVAGYQENATARFGVKFDEAPFFYDLKGTGITVASQGHAAKYIDQFHWISGNKDHQYSYDYTHPQNRERLREYIDGLVEDQKAIEEAAKHATPEEATAAQYELRGIRDELTTLRIFLQGLEEMSTNGQADVATITQMGRVLSKRDYLNGLFEPARGLREVIVAELLEEIYEVLNPIWGTDLGVIPTDFLISLPVTMNSVSYNREMSAGVMGRPLHYRAINYRSANGTPRFWTPQEIVYSNLPGGEQFDVNGHHVDLELISIKAPGIESYFSSDVIYSQKIDRLCVEATKAAESGDENAIPRLISEIKGKLDKATLAAWAKNHPPPKFPKDPFKEIKATIQRVVASKSPISTRDSQAIKHALTKLRRMGHTDQISALWPTLLAQAPVVAKEFWVDSMSIIANERRAIEKAQQRKTPLKEKRPLDFRYIGSLIAMTTFDWGLHDSRKEVKKHLARHLADTGWEFAHEAYGAIGTEFFRRVLTHQNYNTELFFEGSFYHELAQNIIARLILFQLKPLLKNSETVPWKDLEELELDFRGDEGLVKRTVPLSEAIRILGGWDPKVELALAETVEHMTGMPLAPTSRALIMSEQTQEAIAATALLSDLLGPAILRALSDCARSIVDEHDPPKIE